MIIVCPCDQKSFNIDDKLIPKEGRLVKCGVCNHTWFFKPSENTEKKHQKVEEKTITKKVEVKVLYKIKAKSL